MSGDLLGKKFAGMRPGRCNGVTVLLSGCVSTVSGTATRAQHAAPVDVPPLTEANSTTFCCRLARLNDIMGSTKMKVTSELEEMTDHSAEVSDPDCLGAIYGAEEPVYAGSGWTAMRDQVARETRGQRTLGGADRRALPVGR